MHKYIHYAPNLSYPNHVADWAVSEEEDVRQTFGNWPEPCITAASCGVVFL